MNEELYFKTYHRRFRGIFSKDVFFKFYSAIKNEIMKATTFRFSKDTYIQIMNLFKTHASADVFWEVFDLCMQELYDFDIELYASMCKYLFSKLESFPEEHYILLEFYALLELEAKNRPFADNIEGKLNFLLDDFYTRCDDAIEEYFNADRFLFEHYAQKYADVDIPDLYGELIRQNVANKNYRRAFVHLARALFLTEGVCFYKDRQNLVKDYKLNLEVTSYGEAR